MERKWILLLWFIAAMFLCLIAAGCSRQGDDTSVNTEKISDRGGSYTKSTKVVDVINDPVFEEYGRLIFPVDQRIDDDLKLQDVDDILIWYNNVNPDKTVEIANYLKTQAASGEQIFYDIYTEEEKERDPEKEDTGLFFFRGERNAKTAVINAGGGFVYVAAMHDSFPQALELSKKGYNADYSLWGGSAGARMAAWLGSYGTQTFGEDAYPAPAAVIMQYTGLSEITGEEPPTYACVGTNDGIASYRTVETYINRIKNSSVEKESLKKQEFHRTIFIIQVYPNVVSSAIIRVNPTAKAMVPQSECLPADISGISSSITT